MITNNFYGNDLSNVIAILASNLTQNWWLFSEAKDLLNNHSLVEWNTANKKSLIAIIKGSGLSVRCFAEKYNFSRSTLGRWVQQWGISDIMGNNFILHACLYLSCFEYNSKLMIIYSTRSSEWPNLPSLSSSSSSSSISSSFHHGDYWWWSCCYSCWYVLACISMFLALVYLSTIPAKVMERHLLV